MSDGYPGLQFCNLGGLFNGMEIFNSPASIFIMKIWTKINFFNVVIILFHPYNIIYEQKTTWGFMDVESWEIQCKNFIELKRKHSIQDQINCFQTKVYKILVLYSRIHSKWNTNVSPIHYWITLSTGCCIKTRGKSQVTEVWGP